MLGRRVMPLLLLTAILLGPLSGSALAADGDADRLAELDRRLENLQQQVGELTTAKSTQGSEGGIALHGFADVGGLTSSADNDLDHEREGFNVGSLSFYLTPQFGDRVKALFELVFEVEHDGGMESDLERVQIGYSFSDALTAWGGRFHTPYGYWNTAFHHGAQIQTAVTRPRFLDFEDKGGIMQAHAVGAWFTGAQTVAESRIGYDFYAANSPSIVLDESTAPDVVGSLDMNMAGGETADPALGFNLSLRPAALPELMLGVHGYRAKVGVTGSAPSRTRVAMAGGYAVFDNDAWEVMAEYYRFNNRDLSGVSGKHASSAWYAQTGYSVGDLTPYLRFERTALAQADQYFAAQEFGRSYRRSVAGVSYGVNPKTALKFEVNHTLQADLGSVPDDDYREARVRLAVRF
jgi:hypothetical protein